MWSRWSRQSFGCFTKVYLGAGGGAMLGLSLFANQERQPEKFSWHVEYPTEKLDGIQLSRKIVSDLDKTGLDLRLYQYQTCPYCCKVRSFLDYYGFSYEVVEVNPVTRSQLKIVAKGYKKVPVVTSPTVKDPLIESSLIVSLLATFLIRPKIQLEECVDYYPFVPKTNQETQKVEMKIPNQYFVMFEDSLKTQEQIQNAREEREWREWVDSHFIHLISPNVYRTWAEALDTFHFFDEVGEWERNFPSWERYLAIYVGAAAMMFISKRLKKRHNIEDERQALHDAGRKWMSAKGDRTFMGGDEPNLADLSLYGAINSFVGCKAFKEMREQTDIGTWYDAVHKAVQERRGAKLLVQKTNNMK